MILNKKRKGFDMLQLIIYIIVAAILAGFAFLSGSRLMNSAKISVARGDCQSFELAAKQMLLEHPEYIQQKSTSATFTADCTAGLNRYLPTEFQLSGSTLQSAKKDDWGNNYRVVFHSDNATSSYFRIYVVSSGINGASPSDGTIDKDDLIMAVELRNGNVKSALWGFDSDNAASTQLTSLVP